MSNENLTDVVQCIQNKNIFSVVVALTANCNTGTNYLHTKNWYTNYAKVSRMGQIL